MLHRLKGGGFGYGSKSDSKTSRDARGRCIWFRLAPPRLGSCSPNRPLNGKSKITAIPELLDRLDLRGAIVTIDAVGTQKEIARRMPTKASIICSRFKGNQTSQHENTALFFADPVCAADWAARAQTDTGHGRIEERAFAGPPRQAGSPNAIPTGRVCVRSPPSPPGASTRRPPAKASKLATLSPRSSPTATRPHWGVESFHALLVLAFVKNALGLVGMTPKQQDIVTGAVLVGTLIIFGASRNIGETRSGLRGSASTGHRVEQTISLTAILQATRRRRLNRCEFVIVEFRTRQSEFQRPDQRHAVTPPST